MPRSGDETRTKILDAAEALFAARGVDAVSLSEINVAAGQRNNAAVHYHFGTKSTLLDAVLDRHQGEIDAARDAHLDILEQAGRASVRDVARALIEPLATQLDDPSGTRWLQVQAHLLGDPSRSPTNRRPWRRSAERISRLVAAPSRDDPGYWSPARNALINTLVFHGLADYARTHAGRGDDDDRARFVELLVDAAVAIVQLPESVSA